MSATLSAPTLDYAPPPITGLRRRTAMAASWTLVGYGTSQVLRMGSNMILTRILFPQAFGTMALVSIFINGLGMFSDVGIGPSIIRAHRGDDPLFLNTAWTIQVMRGFVLWLASVAIAWPVARLYHEPSFIWMIPLVGLTAVISGFNSTRLFTLSRELMLGRLTMIELISQVSSMTITIAWAWLSPSVIALAMGGITGSAVKATLSFLWLPGIRNGFAWDKSSLAALRSFGKWIFISTMLTFLVGQADRLILGKLVPLDLLGVYSIAMMMALVPTQAIVRVAGPITMSVYSQSFRKSFEHLRTDFSRMRFPITMAGGWAVSLMIVTAPWLMHTLYDHRYAQAGWMIQLIVIAVWFEILETTNGSALLAMGQPRWIAMGNAAKLCGMVALVPLGFHFGGFAGAIIGLISAELMRYLANAIAVRRQGLHSFGSDMFACAMVAGTSLAVLYLGQLLRDRLHWHPAAVILLSIALISTAWAPMAVKFLKIIRPAAV